MTENRDFKGVWIPKEIWLNPNLSIIEKGIYTEISSLDNEFHCVANNEYFANFCQCSVATVTRAISHLIELGYIERVSFDGRQRVLKISNKCMPNQNDEADYSKCNTNNIYNNTNEISKDISSEQEPIDFQFGKKPKKSKPNLYQNCISLINNWTTDETTKKLLVQYLNLCLEMKSLKGANQWKGMLHTLETAKTNSKPEITYDMIIQNSIDHGWRTFYPINNPNWATKSVSDIEGFTPPDINNDGLNHTKSKRCF